MFIVLLKVGFNLILKKTVFKEGRVNERNLIHVTFDVTDVYVCLCCL